MRQHQNNKEPPLPRFLRARDALLTTEPHERQMPQSAPLLHNTQCMGTLPPCVTFGAVSMLAFADSDSTRGLSHKWLHTPGCLAGPQSGKEPEASQGSQRQEGITSGYIIHRRCCGRCTTRSPEPREGGTNRKARASESNPPARGR